MIGYRSAEKRKKCYHDTEIVGIDWCIDGFGINRTAVEVRLETTQWRRKNDDVYSALNYLCRRCLNWPVN